MPEPYDTILDVLLTALVIVGGWSICNSMATIAASLRRLSDRP